MKYWKRAVPLCLASVMAASAPMTAMAVSPEFARTPEEWARLRDNTMEYGELGDLIHEYNVTVQNNQLSYDKDRNKTKDEISQGYLDAANEIENSIDYGDDPASLMSAKTAEASAQSLRKKADDNIEDSQIIKLDYDQAEAALVTQAQTRMISYHQKLLELQLKQKNRELMSVLYDVAAVKKAQGSITEIARLTALENVQNADADILSAQTEIQDTKQKLCVMLGWPYNGSPEIMDVPKADISRISAMNPEADKARAIENNYTLRANKRKLDNSTDTSTREGLQITIKDNEQKIGASLEANYQGVLQAKAAYDQAVSDLAFEEKNMQAAELEYNVVKTISKMEYLQQQYTYLTKQAGVELADMNLFQAMETYDWAVNGLASTQ